MNRETQQVNTRATTQNAQANSQTSGTQISQGNTETRVPINSQGKKKQHVSSQAGQQGKGKQLVRRGGYKGMRNQARPDLHGFVGQSSGAQASGKMGRPWRL